MTEHEAVDVVIIGAGLAGLTCALRLHEAGRTVRLLEAADAVGGRVRTDRHEGFLLDRGFQVFLTSYPEAQRWLDYPALRLKPFCAGALVRYGGRFHRFVDPWRSPRDLLAVALSPVASLGDKLRIFRLRRSVCRGSLAALYERPEQTTAQALRDAGFSERIVERFFRPFLGGVFLDRELNTSSRMFEFVFRMFSLGEATLPSDGMQSIPQQLAARLPSETVQLRTAVDAVSDDGVRLSSGEKVLAGAVVVATDATRAQQLLPDQPFARRQHGVGCLYFAAERPPVEEPILVLNGDGQGPINNLCVPSQIAPSYAPPGQSLVSVTVVISRLDDEPALRQSVLEQSRQWFGRQVGSWRHLRTDWIPAALPAQDPPALSPVIKPQLVRPGRFVCGDHRHTASIQGAMESGRLAAEDILQGGR